MTTVAPASRAFYDRSPIRVAQDLLGRLLVRESAAGLTSGVIVVTEAYLDKIDPACHPFQKRTKRNASMFGPPGHAYVYAIHSRWCFNVVTEKPDVASAVLVRALEPFDGLAVMRERRGRENLLDLARGPARLCEAMAIGRELDGVDLTSGREIFISQDRVHTVPKRAIARSGRIGVTSGHDLPLRFFIESSRFVSAHRRRAL